MAVKLKSPLTEIPSVGPSLAQDLEDLGFKTVSELKNKDPEQLYKDLVKLRGQHQDRCVLYVFRCAVYYATEPNPTAKKLKWWNWKDN